MQLSLSTASLETLPLPPRSSCDGPRSKSDYAAKQPASDSDDGKSSDFDDLLHPNNEKPKSCGAGTRTASKKNSPATASPDSTDSSSDSAAVSSLDPATAPDLAAMLAFMANPVVTPPAPIVTPTMLANGGAVVTGAGLDPATLPGGAAAGPSVAGAASAKLIAAGTAAQDAKVAVDLAAPTILPGQALPAAPATLPAPSSTPTLPAALVATLAANPADTSTAQNVPLVSARPDRRGAQAAMMRSSVGSDSKANIAATMIISRPAEKASTGGIAKNFLTSSEEAVTEGDEALGTDVAKPVETMAAVPISPRQSTAAESAAFSTGGVRQAEASPADFSSQVNDTDSVAHRAVEAVLTAAERVTGERNSVNLQFSVGNNDLAVRVEYRGGTVHATFKTDSPELRAALAHEWSAAGSKMTDASVRMAPPVFTSSNAGGSNYFSGQGAQQQPRDSADRASAQLFAGGPARLAGSDTAAADRGPLVATRAPISTALHLQTFA